MGIRRLEQKRVALWGFGREGRAALAALRGRFPDKSLTVVVPGEDQDRVRGEIDVPGLEVVDDRDLQRTLHGFDVVLKSPGISPYREDLEQVRARGVELVSGTQLWFEEHANERILCVTGTNGKSTTATMLSQLLRARGMTVELGGNIGRPLMSLLDLELRPDLWVVELSSFQTFDLDATPEVAVLLNLHPEHLDWHRTVENYYRDKLRIFAGRGPGTAVVNYRDPVSMQHLSDIHGEKRFFNHPAAVHVKDGALRDGETRLCPVEDFPLPGEHNLSNLCAALTALKAVGGDLHEAVDVLSSLKGLEHRLDTVACKRGLTFVDDSISTTPQSALAALRSYRGCPATILAGGLDRGLDWTAFADAVLAGEAHAVITLPDSGPQIAALIRARRSTLGRASGLELREAENLEAAVELATEITPEGGVVLLSPGAPSFGRFRDYEERGAAFAEAVASL